MFQFYQNAFHARKTYEGTPPDSDDIHIMMDIYGVEEADILKDGDGIIKAVAIAEGITITDVTKMMSVEKIKTVSADSLPEYHEGMCMKERWLDV